MSMPYLDVPWPSSLRAVSYRYTYTHIQFEMLQFHSGSLIICTDSKHKHFQTSQNFTGLLYYCYSILPQWTVSLSPQPHCGNETLETLSRTVIYSEGVRKRAENDRGIMGKKRKQGRDRRKGLLFICLLWLLQKRHKNHGKQWTTIHSKEKHRYDSSEGLNERKRGERGALQGGREHTKRLVFSTRTTTKQPDTAQWQRWHVWRTIYHSFNNSLVMTLHPAAISHTFTCVHTCCAIMR